MRGGFVTFPTSQDFGVQLRAAGLFLGCGVIAALGISLPGCVDPGAPAPLGSASFSAGIRSASTDFMAPTDGPGSMPTTPGAPTAGTPAGAGAPASGTGGSPGVAGSAPIGTGSGGVNAGGAGAAGVGTGTGGMGAGGATVGTGGTAGPPPVAASAGTLTIDFNTVGIGGRYAPRNVGAVWILGPSGKFVKTLERWAAVRAVHLKKWASSGAPPWSAFFGIGAPPDELDAVSRATLGSHQPHHLTWDLKDPAGMVVPDGKYTVSIELADDNSKASVSASATFDKGPAPASVSPPDMAPYTGLKIMYQP